MITKTCAVSGQQFVITDEDLVFYDMMHVPEPTLCPLERMRRRLSWRNHSSLYHRTCDGTDKKIISMYSPDGGYRVYDNEFWWEGAWDGLDYGRDFDFDRPFMPQFSELLKAVPKMARVQQGDNENSRYTNCASYNKNSYLLFTCNHNEDCMYGTDVNECKDTFDGYGLRACELCYECVDCSECYETCFSQRCNSCNSSQYCYECVGCDHCFGCIGLRQQSYHVLNEKVSREEYEALMQDRQKQREVLAKLRNLFLGAPRRWAHFFHCEDCTGDNLIHCKGAKDCYDSFELEDCRYCNNLRSSKTCHDVTHYGATGTNELLYECEGVGHGIYNTKFCKLCWGGGQNLQYCYECFKCQDCFGCTGLQNKQYCIFNKQCTEEAFKSLRDKIIGHMKETGEYGEFLSPSISPFGYNETVVFDHFPLSKDQALGLGYRWRDEDIQAKYEGPTYQIPEKIEDVGDEILDQILLCEVTGKNYRIVKPELAFYRKMNLPIPRLCPAERHRQRMKLRNGRGLYDRPCGDCGTIVQTTYTPDRKERILCETCYLKNTG